jgi:hypothetical protein
MSSASDEGLAMLAAAKGTVFPGGVVQLRAPYNTGYRDFCFGRAFDSPPREKSDGLITKQLFNFSHLQYPEKDTYRR